MLQIYLYKSCCIQFNVIFFCRRHIHNNTRALRKGLTYVPRPTEETCSYYLSFFLHNNTLGITYNKNVPVRTHLRNMYKSILKRPYRILCLRSDQNTMMLFNFLYPYIYLILATCSRLLNILLIWMLVLYPYRNTPIIYGKVIIYLHPAGNCP